MKIIITISLSILLFFNLLLVNGIFGFFKYLETGGEIDTQYKVYSSLYKKLDSKIGGKNYFSEGENSIIIKKIYYLNGQKIDGIVTMKEGNVVEKTNILFDSLVKNRGLIEQVEVNAVNGKIIDGKIILTEEDLDIQSNIEIFN